MSGKSLMAVAVALLLTLAAVPAPAFDWPAGGGRRCWDVAQDASWLKLRFIPAGAGTYQVVGRDLLFGTGIRPVAGTAVTRGDNVFMTWTESWTSTNWVVTTIVSATISRTTGTGTGHYNTTWGDTTGVLDEVRFTGNFPMNPWSCTERPQP